MPPRQRVVLTVQSTCLAIALTADDESQAEAESAPCDTLDRRATPRQRRKSLDANSTKDEAQTPWTTCHRRSRV